MTAPLLVIGLIFLAAAGGGGSGASTSPSPGAALPAVSVAAPPSTDGRTVSQCAQVISALPLVLDGQSLRRTTSNPASPSIVAWGDPAIVFRCGVARPPDLKVNSNTVFPSVTGDAGPFWDVTTSGDANVWTTVDRSIYVQVSVPSKYNSAPLPPVATAVAKVLPAVCVGGQPVSGPLPPPSKLCTHRP